MAIRENGEFVPLKKSGFVFMNTDLSLIYHSSKYLTSHDISRFFFFLRCFVGKGGLAALRTIPLTGSSLFYFFP